MESVQVKEYMNHYPVIFTPEMAVEKASSQLLKTQQRGGPVVDDNNQLIGFLSENDVLTQLLESTFYNQHTANVADLMHKEVLSVKPYDSIVEVAQRMVQNKPKIYPVVDDDGNLLGTISRTDVLAAIDFHYLKNFKRN